ncbi:MAG TPA: EAL domain-containing response regulator [Stellaceae bacterium]|nr:EAL domain-containing response regulator [Stellaceae bacterium]
MRTLVLDDDPSVGRFVCRAAQTAGFQTQSATRIAAFRSHYLATRPDVVVLDLQIGADNGIDQLHFLNEHRFRNPILLMSEFDGRVLSAAQQIGREMGLDIAATMTKPIRLDEITALFVRLAQQLRPLSAERVLDAVRANELFLEYQPIVERRPRRVLMLEALVRWNHPAHGRLAPDRFIPLAEKSAETIDALTDWVLAMAARDYVRFRAAGNETSIAVNVSGKNLDQLDFPDRVEDILRRVKVPPERFSLELTETAASSDHLNNMDVFSRLRLKGFGLAIDDFGTGYSSLKRLRELPFTSIKIDHSFVLDLPVSRDAAAIVKSVADLAHNMQLECIAEGVETEQIAQILEGFGVNKQQGYLYARPQSADRVEVWLKDGKQAA